MSCGNSTRRKSLIQGQKTALFDTPCRHKSLLRNALRYVSPAALAACSPPRQLGPTAAAAAEDRGEIGRSHSPRRSIGLRTSTRPRDNYPHGTPHARTFAERKATFVLAVSSHFSSTVPHKHLPTIMDNHTHVQLAPSSPRQPEFRK